LKKHSPDCYQLDPARSSGLDFHHNKHTVDVQEHRKFLGLYQMKCPVSLRLKYIGAALRPVISFGTFFGLLYHFPFLPIRALSV
jgi:hypothetical protein